MSRYVFELYFIFADQLVLTFLSVFASSFTLIASWLHLKQIYCLSSSLDIIHEELRALTMLRNFVGSFSLLVFRIQNPCICRFRLFDFDLERLPAHAVDFDKTLINGVKTL